MQKKFQLSHTYIDRYIDTLKKKIKEKHTCQKYEFK